MLVSNVWVLETVCGLRDVSEEMRQGREGKLTLN